MRCHSSHLRNISKNHSSLMAKSDLEVDLDDWEFLPDNKTFLDPSLGSQKDVVLIKEIAVDTNYFVCPSRPLVAEEEEAPKSALGSESTKEMNAGEAAGGLEIKDIGVIAVHPAPEQLQEEGLVLLEDETEKEKDRGAGSREIKVKDGSGLTVWNWRLTGIGALCSMGAAAAAASICVLIVGGRQHQKQRRPEQKIHLKMYADEKRMKEVVEQATRLNQALTAVRGIPMTRARISFGGYCASV